MKAFRGRLSDYRLSLVVPALYEAKRASGVLTVNRGRVVREFFIQRGTLIEERSNEPGEHLAQVLADLQILDSSRAAEAFEAAERAGTPLGLYLIERGLLDHSRLMEGLLHKAREAFFDCYTWESGDLSFEPELPERSGKGVSLGLELSSLHRDAMERMQEWRRFREVFPSSETTFDVKRGEGGGQRNEREEAMLDLAEEGFPISELLTAASEGRLFAARRLLTLYRRGALTPKNGEGPKATTSADLESMLSLARKFLAEGAYESAAAVASQALDRAPVPEAHALFRQAEHLRAQSIADEVIGLEGRLICAPLPAKPPASLTADDLYLYSKLKSASSLKEALKSAAMGEMAAFRSVLRLISARLLVLDENTPESVRKKTDPYGYPVLRN